jgi:hypothetical protein
VFLKKTEEWSMLKCKWCLVLGILAIGTFALAHDIEGNNVTSIDEGATMGGTLMGGAGVTPPEGDIVYHSATLSGYYFRPYPGYVDFDDIHLEPGPNGDLVKYSFTVFGSMSSGSDAGLPFDVYSALYTDSDGDPAIGIPDTMIAGTDCTWLGVPTGMWVLECVVPAGIEIPQGLWMSLEFSNDNCGWSIADFNDCPNTGPPGYSEDFWAELDLYYMAWSFYWFGGCPVNPQSSYGNAMIVAEGAPWACCDFTTYDCVNVMETECDDLGGSFTEGTLCNNLPAPCSEAGACCNVPTGVCTDTFALFCDGYLQAFYPGQLCTAIDCEVPDNVPTLTQWGMIALTVVLLTGLTIKFGRRRTVTA